MIFLEKANLINVCPVNYLIESKLRPLVVLIPPHLCSPHTTLPHCYPSLPPDPVHHRGPSTLFHISSSPVPPSCSAFCCRISPCLHVPSSPPTLFFTPPVVDLSHPSCPVQYPSCPVQYPSCPAATCRYRGLSTVYCLTANLCTVCINTMCL